MTVALNLTPAEMVDLEQLLKEQVEEIRTELRRTRKPEYKNHVVEHLHTVEHILAEVTRVHDGTLTAA